MGIHPLRGVRLWDKMFPPPTRGVYLICDLLIKLVDYRFDVSKKGAAARCLPFGDRIERPVRAGKA
jgi:hypothetical protein